MLFKKVFCLGLLSCIFSINAVASTTQCPVDEVDCSRSVCIPIKALSGWNIAFQAGLKDGRYYFAGARANKTPAVDVHGNCLYTLNRLFPEKGQKEAVALLDAAQELTPDTGSWSQSTVYNDEEDCKNADIALCKFKVH
ncbi:MAG: hypothetical protein K0S08_1444 [Gammaproteobacteria bacterium]|jgi:hypothetical protein|nr:hypothetical protein [Gammaproteobacteria bacterium]